MDFELVFKFIIVGDTDVGKSCIVLRFTDNTFNAKTESTVGVEFGARTLFLDKKTIKLQLWDTAGQETFKSITRSYYRSSAAAFIVYDTTSRKSFDNCQSWLDELEMNGNDFLNLCIIGNKCDLEDLREVPKKEGEKLAKENDALFFEVSAFDGTNVDKAFKEMTRKVIKKLETCDLIEDELENIGIKRVGESDLLANSRGTNDNDKGCKC